MVPAGHRANALMQFCMRDRKKELGNARPTQYKTAVRSGKAHLANELITQA